MSGQDIIFAQLLGMGFYPETMEEYVSDCHGNYIIQMGSVCKQPQNGENMSGSISFPHSTVQ